MAKKSVGKSRKTSLDISFRDIKWVSPEKAKEAICKKITSNSVVGVKLKEDGSNVMLSLSAFLDIINDIKLSGLNNDGVISDTPKNFQVVSDELMDLSQSVFSKMKPEGLAPSRKKSKSNRRRKLRTP